MRRRSVGLLLSIAIAASLAAAPVQAQDELTIASSMPALEFPFFVHMQKELREEAEALGGITLIETDGENSAPKQTADVEAAITQGVDGIIISPIDTVAMAPVLQDAVDAGIPVVTIDRRVDGVEGILGHVGADNVIGGEAQGTADRGHVPGRRHDREPAGPARLEPGHRPQPGPAQRARRHGRHVPVRRRADRATSRGQRPSPSPSRSSPASTSRRM